MKIIFLGPRSTYICVKFRVESIFDGFRTIRQLLLGEKSRKPKKSGSAQILGHPSLSNYPGSYCRHFPAGQEARSVSAFPVLRFRSSSPSEATTWTWRHSLKHSFCAHPHTADTIIAIGHVFVNLTQKVRQNLVPKLVPNMPVLKLNLTFWSFFSGTFKIQFPNCQ